MQRRGESEQPVKGRRNKAPRPKARKAPSAHLAADYLPEQFDRLKRERDEALEQLAATSEVLKIVSRSTSNLSAALDMLLETACRLCEADIGTIRYEEGAGYRLAATFGCQPEWHKHFAGYSTKPDRSSVFGQTILKGSTVHIRDVLEDPDYARPQAQKLTGLRAALGVPLMRDGHVFGVVNLFRTSPRAFTQNQIDMVETFAAQATVAIETARLLNELRESLQQQTATADVLKVISSSPGDLAPVFKAMLENAVHICEAKFGHMFLREAEGFRVVALESGTLPYPDWLREGSKLELRENPQGPLAQIAATGKIVHIGDLTAEVPYVERNPRMVALVESSGARTFLGVPMFKGETQIGAVVIYRQEVRPFTDKQIELVKNFAAQAVIAIENTRLLNELRQRTDDLSEALEQQTATSEVLKVVSSSPGDMKPVFEAMLANALRICDAKFGHILLYDGERYHAAYLHEVPSSYREFWEQHGPIRPGPNTGLARLARTKQVSHIPDLKADATYAEREPLRVVTVEQAGARSLLAVPMLKENDLIGAIVIYRQEVRPFTDKQIELVKNFAAQAVIAIENTRLLNELRQRTHELATSLNNLRTTQDRLVQTQKLASLGQLTAGIAHEIKNPLNFVNNFSGISTELIGELQDTLRSISIDPETHAEIKELTDTLRGNLEKVVHHGKRADTIVKSMLLHSGQSSGEHRSTDINALVEESLNRAYYGARAEERGFNIKMERSFDPAAGEVDLFPREITRALLNLISNGFYAATKRKAEVKVDDHEPTLIATTKNLGDHVEIRIRDNGTGIPADVREKMFDPFFTTKPAGEGAGLGLSISHDIIVKQHGGSIEVDTKPGEFAEIRVILPRTAASLLERS